MNGKKKGVFWMNDRPIPRAGEFYMHFKGKLYQIVTVATHTETEEALVIYQALYGTYKTYARPLTMFLSEVDHEKYPEVEQKYRFRKVELGENAGDHVYIKTAKTEEDQGTKEEQTQEVQVRDQQETVQQEEVNIEPLLKFLDATDLNDRLNVLMQYRDDINDIMIDSMGAAMDCVLNGRTLEEKYYELDKVIRTKLQYEKKPRI